MLSAAGLAAALRDPEWCEAPVTDAISPLTVVDITGARNIAVPTITPRLFVGLARNEGDAPALDMVAADDELELIALACTKNPLAVIALAQLLRATERVPIADAVLAESLAYSMLLAGAEHGRWRAAQPRRRHRPDDVPVQVGDDGETLTITLDRPQVRNAYDAATRDALVDILHSALALGDARTVVLRGAGPSFCSGGDLTEFGTSDDPARAHTIRTTRRPGLLLHALGPRAVARVHGACVGAGTELPAFCARVEARGDATFRLPEIAMGLIPGAGGTASLPRRIGRRRTAWLAITDRPIDAHRALAWGLVDALIDDDDRITT